MGKLLKTKSLTTGAEALIVMVVLALVGFGVYQYAPGLRTQKSVTMETMELDNQVIDNVNHSEMLPLPSKSVSTAVQKNPRVTIAGYAWNGQTGIYTANGGAFTTKGSLMEQKGVNLNLVRQDWLSELRNMQMKFIEQYDAGQEYPESDKAAFAIMIMGDGAPFYISTMNKALVEKFNSKYSVEVVGAIGMSNGEDKLIGPPEWKANPQTMIGKTISVVIGDGDWVTALNYCFANGLPVNPNFNSHDPTAVNFYPSAEDDYVNSAKELIQSQTTGWTVNLPVSIKGKLTGERKDVKIDGCATWTPADKMVFDALTGFTDIASTADFPNQMPTTIIAVKQWAASHPEIVQNILSATYTANNQIKQYDQWQRRGSEAIADGFGMETPEYWYKMFKGQTGTKAGISYSMGGSRVLTYADAMQYYGITDGVNRYRSVYEQVSNYLVTLNPFDFNSEVETVTPYDEAVNLRYLRNTDVESAGTITKLDYWLLVTGISTLLQTIIKS
jgi:OOP family OmpA-OmpF porin